MATILNSQSIYDSGKPDLQSYNRVLVVGGVDANSSVKDAAVFNPARLATDKDDYVPGEVVWLSGAGWKPDEYVAVWVVDSKGWEYKPTSWPTQTASSRAQNRSLTFWSSTWE